MVLTSPWVTADRGPSTRGPVWNYRFDNIEITPADPNAGSTFADALCGLGGARYLLFVNDQSTWDYCNPFLTNDMSAMGGGNIDGMFLLWYQRAALPPTPPVPGGEQLFIATQFFETTITADCLTADPVDFHDGYIFDFGVNPNGFWYTTIDLSAFGFTTLPLADGSGSYQIIYGSAFDPGTGEITLSTCAQPGLWGTAAPRVGTQHDIQYDDDFPTDGVHVLPDECYTYAYGVCPDPLGAAIGLVGMDSGGCPCPGDTNGDNLRDISDLAVLLSAFGSSPPAPGAECSDMNGDGIIDIADLALLLAAFGSTC
jgi:hypothetical protein